jgi:hypothetical protein
MTSEDWISLASVLATVTVAVVSLLVSARQQVRHQRREDDLRDQHQRREDELRRVHREDAPRLEFTIEGETLGKREVGQLLALTISLHNRGLIQWKLNSIQLRIRGIEADQPLSYWKGYEPRVEFPVRIVDDAEIVPGNVNFLFVEPGVAQSISYVTKIPTGIEYLLVHIEFNYDKYTPHTAERLFHVSQS